MMRIILAHGVLGPLDELAYLIPEIIFFLSMTLGWMRARKLRTHVTSNIEDSATLSNTESESTPQ